MSGRAPTKALPICRMVARAIPVPPMRSRSGSGTDAQDGDPISADAPVAAIAAIAARRRNVRGIIA
jgi:hypothetical protein